MERVFVIQNIEVLVFQISNVVSFIVELNEQDFADIFVEISIKIVDLDVEGLL